MGKKRKEKKKVKKFLKEWNLNSKSIEILKSGKIKFKKDEKIDIGAYVENSIIDAKISRLEGIPSKEEIVIDGSTEYRINATTNCSSIARIIELISSINTNEVQTIVLPMTKKKALNLENNDIVSWLGGSSTFAAVYNKLQESWEEINTDDKTPFTNVMFIPKLYIFIEKNGKLRKKPIVVNLMIVALPSINKSKVGVEATDKIEYTNRIINDTMDACIRCGCKSVVVDPFSMTTLKEDVHYTSRYWHGKTETQRVIENIRNITFSIDNDDLYVIFCKNK
jgi:hypothetical protein